ncbi:MAG: lipid-A-disaccharide synthase-related protein [Cyanobacteriota bacterium]|nr:lipid-A-disaccharide synthase-related protein [Cyanobacteriota bacterium]
MAPRVSRVLLVSNGHGEDLSGALLGKALRQRGMTVEAMPLVGHGEAYRRENLRVLGPTRDFSTGGLGYTSLRGRLTELRQGQLSYLLQRLWAVWRQGRQFDWVLVVGDVLPVLAGWLTGKPMAVYLVAYSSHYEGLLRLPWPCGWLLKRPGVRLLWSRDALTARDLTRQLRRSVQFVGNPFLDVAGPPAAASPVSHEGPVLGLLPGSRLPEALSNLMLMLAVLSRLPSECSGRLRLLTALVSSLTPKAIARAASPQGWTLESLPNQTGAPAVLNRGGLRLELVSHHFWWVLQSSDLLLAMAGTATEQAVALGKPVLQIVGPGPQFTEGFADAQRRLLGPAVSCAPGPMGAPSTLSHTACMVAEQLARLADPEEGTRWRKELTTLALERLGTPGGTARMADAIMANMQLLSSTADGSPSR